MSRSLSDLEPATRALAEKFLAGAQDAGFDVLVTCTSRTQEEQAALWAQGRSKPGPVVTWAQPGQSMHETGRAFDVVPMRAGKCVWGVAGADGELWQAIGKLGESVGLEWAGRWPRRIREFPHFQLSKK